MIDNGWKGKFGIQEYDEEEDLEGSSEDSSDGEIVKNNTKNDVEKVDALK